MKETVFKNQTFKVCLIITLTLLIIWNLYTFIMLDSIKAIVRGVIQFIILMMVVTKSEYAKPVVNIFAILMIIGSSLSILGKLIKLSFDQFDLEMLINFISNFILLAIGIAIYHFNTKTVIVKAKVKKAEEM